LAGALYGIPLFGTSAHSYIQAHTDEATALEHFARSYLDNAILLIDTYDTEAAAMKVVSLAHKLSAEGIRIKGVRLDSGDLAEHARRVRCILDEGGLENVSIFASGNLDEYRLQALVSPPEAQAAPIDGFGVGTALDVSSDAPSLDCAYKLQEYAGRARRKRSEGKATWPGRKQVYRNYDVSNNFMAGDIVALEGEDPHGGEPLIVPVMRSGKRINGSGMLDEMRKRTVASYALLPQCLAAIDTSSVYPVEISTTLRSLAQQLDAGAESS
jgi:nicotinate phosphoribosyltransferase